MNIIKKFGLMAAIATTLFAVSCSKDNSTPTTNGTATQSTTIGNSTLRPGDSTTLVTSVSGGSPASVDYVSSLKGKTLNVTGSGPYTLTYLAPDVTGTQTDNLNINVKDASGTVIASGSQMITVLGPVTFTSQTLGYATNSSTPAAGSAFSADNSTVYRMADAISNSSKVDFIYYNDGTPILASPSDATAQGSANVKANTGIDQYGTKNVTTFKTYSGSIPGNATQSVLKSAFNSASGSGSTSITISSGSTYSFMTMHGTQPIYGLLTVNSLVPGHYGTITISGVVTQ